MTTRPAEPQILVHGVGINLGEALQGHVRQSTEQMKEKYFRKLTSATISFKCEHSVYSCMITYQAGGLRPNIVNHESHDIHNAFNGAKRKLEAQLKRIKTLRHDHHHAHARPDKDLQLDGEHRVSPRTVARNRPEHDLTTPQGADAYSKALLQKAEQDARQHREAMAESAYRIAAE